MTTPDRERIHRVFEVTGHANAKDAALASSRRFVRGRTQISSLESGRHPKGHIISAFEALQSYGIDVLDEAIEYGSAILLKHLNAVGKALRRQRETLGLDLNAVSRSTGVRVPDIMRIEAGDAFDFPMQTIERMAFILGLDEGQIAFHETPGGAAVAARLKTLQAESLGGGLRGLSRKSVVTLAEAASVIRVQHRLQQWLDISGSVASFHPSRDYGNHSTPAWRIGYQLAANTRTQLRMGAATVPSMREFVQNTLGIPVVHAELPQRIAGATIAVPNGETAPYRGIVLNTTGANTNPLVRRATLAHEVGHLLFDPDQNLNNVRVDSYAGLEADPQRTGPVDFVEQRANAFAISLLAPIDIVRERTNPPITSEHIADTVSSFGISLTAASFHVANAHYRNFPVPHADGIQYDLSPWRAAEDFDLDYFPIADTPCSMRGRFAGLVVAAWKGNLISPETAAGYLRCSDEIFLEQAEAIQDIHPVHTSALNGASP